MRKTPYTLPFLCLSNAKRRLVKNLVTIWVWSLAIDEPSQPSPFPLSAAGLDWSEESGEEPEDSDQASPYQVAWSIRETLRYERHT